MKKFDKLNDAINPALGFINTQQKDTQPKTTQIKNTQFKVIDDKGNITQIQLPEGTTINNMFREKRTKRVQVVIQPNKFNQMKEQYQC